ncbi:MAG: chlorophyll synthesis pathway protein BchC [Aestuariivita sp.]|nr:chlorophyll synthesis pathway protein BchC [Aestuariivita sp.]
MKTSAVVLKSPRDLQLEMLELKQPGENDLVVEINYSGISTGTEKLFWSGEMPPFPGMSYPLVPGYEAAGEVVHAGSATGFRSGEFVFVPGADCYTNASGLFGGAAKRLVTDAHRVTRINSALKSEGTLLALAATALHAMLGQGKTAPELIVGHGVLGRLLARLTVAMGAPAPTVWEINADRRKGTTGYPILTSEDDPRFDYKTIYDASGNGSILNDLIRRLQKGGEIVLAGFYSAPLSFAYPPAFMKEARLRVASEWERADLQTIREFVDNGSLSLANLITHEMPACQAIKAYEMAFEDSSCLKMILNWESAL